MTATDGEALLRAILDDPGDDLPRLAYADWLEDQGEQQRAEFIRVQLMIAGRLSRQGRGIGPLLLREGALLSVGGHVFEWLGEWTWRALPGTPAVHHKSGGECLLYHDRHEDSRWAVTFRRGFVESVRCALDGWREHGPAIVRAHPVTRVKCPDAFASRDVPGGRWGVTLRVPIPPVLDEALSQVGWHDSQAACDDALSAALLWWARATRPRRR